MTRSLGEAVAIALRDLLPAMTVDGGGVEPPVIDEERGHVRLTLLGTCLYCPSRIASARALCTRLHDAVPNIALLEVRAGETLLAHWPNE